MSKLLAGEMMSEAASRMRASAVLTTRFLKREFGMTDYDYLASASATIVRSKDLSFPRRVHVVANGHVALPWRFLKLASAEQAEWLQHVTHDDATYELSLVCEVTGVTLAGGRLTSLEPRLHHDRDLAVLYLEDESAFYEAMQSAEFDLLTPSLAPGRAVADDEFLAVAGHFVDETDKEPPVPAFLDARLRGQTKHQTFLHTSEVLKQGFCGAPVLFSDATCAGIIDGIVPPLSAVDAVPKDDLRAVFAGCASLVPADTIQPFLDRLEKDDDLRSDLQARGGAPSPTGENPLPFSDDADWSPPSSSSSGGSSSS